MMIPWKRSAGDVWSASLPPFALKIQPKGDGRWTWEIYSGETPNPTASGVRSSLGAAKTTVEQFVKRSGLF
jgi:hypothetical protein